MGDAALMSPLDELGTGSIVIFVRQPGSAAVSDPERVAEGGHGVPERLEGSVRISALWLYVLLGDRVEKLDSALEGSVAVDEVGVFHCIGVQREGRPGVAAQIAGLPRFRGTRPGSGSDRPGRWRRDDAEPGASGLRPPGRAVCGGSDGGVAV